MSDLYQVRTQQTNQLLTEQISNNLAYQVIYTDDSEDISTIIHECLYTKISNGRLQK